MKADEHKYWFIETEDGKRIEGPFRTEFEANQRRVVVERETTETFWIRDSFISPVSSSRDGEET